MDNDQMSLDGAWKLRWADGQRGGLLHHHLWTTHPSKWIDAIVPGEVHLDLLRAGMIPEPTLGVSILESRWVEESFWSYRRVFSVPDAALSARSWLRFEALDYGATIFLNEEPIGSHGNAFLPYEVDVTGKLIAGDNLLVVELESGLYSVAEQPIKDFYRGAEDGRLYKRVWLRKPQFSFSWDWAPRLINIGIGGRVSLGWADRARVIHTSIQSQLSSDGQSGHLVVSVQCEGLDSQPVPAEMSVTVAETGQTTVQPVVLNPGRQGMQMEIAVANPKCWWPMGYGAQDRYTVEVRVLVDGQTVGVDRKRIGFRHVRFNQEEDSRGGRRFILEINGHPIFAKGANWVPPDIILARVDRQRYQTLIARALELNFNFLRIWGGGIYESDEFYELCDEQGILVWQEFAFACAAYPATNADFLENITLEARYQVRRLAHHPSLIAWCGNNEIEWLNWDRNQGVVRPDFAWFHQTLPRILAAEDPGRYYQPSSPYSPDGQSPNAKDRGDQHPWDIGFGNVDFHGYRRLASRFPNEGGILGPPSLPTMEAALPADQRAMHSFAWELHDNSVEDWYPESSIDRMTSEWIGKDAETMSLPEYVYYGGLLQGEGLREYIDNFRRRKFETSSAIFWMYNDCWPTTRSWTVIDYYLRRTPAFYPVKRAFAPLAVVVVREEDRVKVYGINDQMAPWTGTLHYGIFTIDGTDALDQETVVEIPPNSSKEIVSFTAERWEMMGTTRALAYAMLSEQGIVVARNRLILPRFKDLRWVPAAVEVRREGPFAVFTSPTFAWGVCLDLNGEAVGDNFFDVWPNIPYRVPWPTNQALPKVLFVGNLANP